ncbi:glycosyltransferase family 2 protein [Streptomyces sp. TE33382]
MSGEPQISVVIPAYRTRRGDGTYHGTLRSWTGLETSGHEGDPGLRRLQLSLVSLERQTIGRDRFEVVLVDDGSEYDLAAEVAGWDLDLPLRVIRRPHAGFCHAFNHGVSQARGELVFLGLDHAIFAPGTLRSHVDAYRGHTDAPGEAPWVGCGRQLQLFHSVLFRDPTQPSVDPAHLAALGRREGLGWLPQGVRHLNPDRKPITLDDARGNFTKLEYLAARTPEYADIDAVLSAGAHDRRCGWLVMRVGNHSLPRALWDELGGLDDGLDEHRGWYADLDLGLRLHRAGTRFGFVPGAVTLDLFHGGARGAATAKSTGLVHMLAKHPAPEVLLLPHYLDQIG